MNYDKLIVGDTETTDIVDPRICEVAWCEITAGLEILGEFDSLVNPQHPIHCVAAGVSGIRNEDVVDSPLIAELPWPEGDHLLIAHNAKFDAPLMSPYMSITETLCTLQLARRLLPDAPKYDLQTLSCYLDLPRQIAHRAIGDVRTCLGLLEYLVEGSGMTIAELVQWTKQPVLVKIMPFGKHSGTAIDRLPKSYVGWLKQQDLDIDMRYTLDKVWG